MAHRKGHWDSPEDSYDDAYDDADFEDMTEEEIESAKAADEDARLQYEEDIAEDRIDRDNAKILISVLDAVLECHFNPQ